MSDLVIAVDAARARWFGLVDERLRERRNMVEPERRVPGHVLFSESKPGQRAHAGGRTQGLDDRRMAHVREVERRFAREIAEATSDDVAGGVTRVVLVSDARMLGHLRGELARLDVDVVEVPINVAKREPHDIQDALAERGLIGARPRK